MDINPKADHHTHSLFSDGSASIEEMILAARAAGLEEVTITDHMPLPFDTRYAMDKTRVDEYRQTIQDARKLHSQTISVGMGMEIEFIPEFRHWIQPFSTMNWDRLIVSIHSLMIDGRPFLVNGNREEYNALLHQFDHDLKSLCRHYFRTLQEGLLTGWFDVAGHLDVVKKWTAPEEFIDESAPWYRQLIDETLAIIQSQQMSLEINTGGFLHKAAASYPSKWIVREALDRGIPITLGSDAHAPAALGQFFRNTLAGLDSVTP